MVTKSKFVGDNNMLECGLNKCICIEDTTVEGIEVGKIYPYIYTPEYETDPKNRTYIVIYNNGKYSLPCTYDYFQQYFAEHGK